MSNAAEQARKYLQEKNISIIFESLMTALMYHKPDDPVDFMLRGLSVIKVDPNQKIAWDMFIDTPPPPMQQHAPTSRTASANARRLASGRLSMANEESVRRTPPPASASVKSLVTSRPPTAPTASRDEPVFNDVQQQTVDAAIVLLFGGPGGRKSVVAEDVAKSLEHDGEQVAHVAAADAIRRAVEANKNSTEAVWQDAVTKYEAGQPIADRLALQVVKDELAKKRDAKLIILDGYPRTLSQVADFDREVKRPQLAIIIDFDEDTLRKDLEHKNLSENVINSRLQEYKSHSLPAAKHYDDAFLLHLIAGEQSSDGLVEQFKGYINKVLHKPTATDEEENDGTRTATVNGEGGGSAPRRDVPVVVIIGSPGSLKGEYCRRLVKRYDGFVHLSMGELLKQKAANDDDDESKEISECLEKGELVPNTTCTKLIFKAMREHPNSWGFILEGYPRDLAQAEEFDSQIDRTDLVLLIDCTEQYCLSNLLERLGGDEQAGRSRIAVFKQRTLPMLKHYDEKVKLKVVEGDRSVDEVFQDVIQALDGVFIPQESADGKSLSNAEES